MSNDCAATEARARPCSADVLQHDFVTGQRFAGPIGADQVEHAVLDRVPLGGSCGIMSDSDRQSEFISQVLQAHLPSPTTVAIGTSAVGFDGQPRHARIPTPPNLQPPRTNGTHRKGRRLMGCADHDIARRCDFRHRCRRDRRGLGPVWESRGPARRDPHTAKLRPLFLKLPTNSFFFVSTLITGHPCRWNRRRRRPNRRNCRSRSGIFLPTQPLAVRSQRVLLCSQQAGHRHMPDLYATSPSMQRPSCGWSCASTADLPSDRRPSHPATALQQLPHTRRFFSTRFRPPPGRRTRSEDAACPRSLSRNPRRIVMRLRPVISATCWMPPCPRCLATIPANNRRLRSSSSAITRLMARWYATKSVSLRERHPRQRHRWIRLRSLSAMTVSPSLEAEYADYTNGQVIFEQRLTLSHSAKTRQHVSVTWE